MELKKYLIGVLFLGVTVFSNAYEAGEWTKVAQIYAQNNGTVFVYLGSNSMTGCYNDNAAYLKGDNIDKLYSTILAAHMSEKQIKPLYQFDNTDEGYSGWGLCYIYGVYIK
ncbi:hypothetical protein [Teredinibacter turnerae]|uniref:Uncharacterized protein n=1 Tax=Teredinibacter turnerae (strain ATCC 39867 / T7901) TaxID=377629 RepID=C5BM33_TERTT|nr:hypothetical protein [Teredinibacter turnerae]ACR13944.1 conserved hypothetical protein [Teredinibacter turnerae T7901]